MLVLNLVSTWRDNYRLWVFKDMVLWKIFGLEWDKVTGEWRGLHDREVYRGADKSLAQPGRKQDTATEDFDFYISYL
jgi:hypothetical protein